MDRHGIEQLIATCYPGARRLALLVCKDATEADDLTQDAVLRLIRRPPRPMNEAIVRAWLRTTIMRLYLGRQRSLRREARAVLRLSAREPDAIESEPSGPSAEVLEALRSLSPKQRACVALRYLDDLSEADVARTLGLREGTVKAHLAVARARLRALLGQTADVAEHP